jgi:hypothetical protein
MQENNANSSPKQEGLCRFLNWTFPVGGINGKLIFFSQSMNYQKPRSEEAGKENGPDKWIKHKDGRRRRS